MSLLREIRSPLIITGPRVLAQCNILLFLLRIYGALTLPASALPL